MDGDAYIGRKTATAPRPHATLALPRRDPEGADMIALLRFMIVGFVVLTVVYVSVSLYSRSVRREKLEREWDEEIGVGDRDLYIREGLEAYDHSLRRRLILAVYVIPAIVIGAIVYFVNYT